MVSVDVFRNLALAFPFTEEAPHFNRIAFKITGKKIFATLDEKTGSANLLLLPEDQNLYASFDINFIYAVPNKWGLKGWTTFELKNLSGEIVSDALYTAYQHILHSQK